MLNLGVHGGEFHFYHGVFHTHESFHERPWPLLPLLPLFDASVWIGRWHFCRLGIIGICCDIHHYTTSWNRNQLHMNESHWIHLQTDVTKLIFSWHKQSVIGLRVDCTRIYKSRMCLIVPDISTAKYFINFQGESLKCATVHVHVVCEMLRVIHCHYIKMISFIKYPRIIPANLFSIWLYKILDLRLLPRKKFLICFVFISWYEINSFDQLIPKYKAGAETLIRLWVFCKAGKPVILPSFLKKKPLKLFCSQFTSWKWEYLYPSLGTCHSMPILPKITFKKTLDLRPWSRENMSPVVRTTLTVIRTSGWEDIPHSLIPWIDSHFETSWYLFC